MGEGRKWYKSPGIIFGATLVVAVILGWLVMKLNYSLAFAPQPWADIFERLELMLVVALLIERAVEVYLSITQKNGPDRFGKKDKDPADRPPATKTATAAAFALGLLVSLAGLRLLAVMLCPTGESRGVWLWNGVDIVITAGLLAGGSTLIHEVMEALRGFLNLPSLFLPGGKKSSKENLSPGSAEYQIRVERKGESQGTLIFNERGVSLNSECWWDPKVRIAADVYINCIATRMDNKLDTVTRLKRPGIFIQYAVAPGTGKDAIYIHEGENPNQSDGCIVLPRDEMMRIWNVIEKDQENVTIHVVDV